MDGVAAKAFGVLIRDGEEVDGLGLPGVCAGLEEDPVRKSLEAPPEVGAAAMDGLDSSELGGVQLTVDSTVQEVGIAGDGSEG